MAAVPALMRSYNSLLPKFPSYSSEALADEPSKLDGALKTLFPDLLVHGTRSYLLGMTSSLTKVSSQAHQYFTRLSQVLAFERMMRSFVRLTAAVSPFPIDTAALNYWNGLFLSGPQAAAAWGYPAAKPQVPALPFFGGTAAQRPAAMGQMPAWSDYNAALFILPATLLAAAPAVEKWWKFSL